MQSLKYLTVVNKTTSKPLKPHKNALNKHINTYWTIHGSDGNEYNSHTRKYFDNAKNICINVCCSMLKTEHVSTHLI